MRSRKGCSVEIVRSNAVQCERFVGKSRSAETRFAERARPKQKHRRRVPSSPVISAMTGNDGHSNLSDDSLGWGRVS